MPLTVEEREVLRGVANGETARVTAARLHRSPSWVSARRQELRRRFGVESVAAAVLVAEAEGLLVQSEAFIAKRATARLNRRQRV